MRQERGGYLRQHLAVASLAEKEKKKGYISIYRQRRKGRWGLGFPHCPMSPPSPGLMAKLSNALGNQVPIEVIWYLLIGPRRGDWWPRDHVVCCGERKGD